MAEAQAPAAEAYEPRYTPDQARDRAARLASKLATTPAWPAISRAAHTLDLDALRREPAARVGVDTLVMGTEDEGINTGGRTPLQLACEATNEMIVYRRGGTEEAFLGWAASSPSRRGEIDEGIHADRIACVALLLVHGASPNPVGPLKTPLMGAARNGNLAVVNMLLSAGSDPNALYRCAPNFTDDVWSALYLTVLSQRGDCAAIADALLKAGADPNPPEHAERSLMEWAIWIADRDRCLWPVLLRGGAILPPRVNPNNGNAGFQAWNNQLARPYLEKIEAAGSWTAYEKAHRAKLLATFTPKFTHLVPASSPIVPLIVEYSFHLGFY